MRRTHIRAAFLVAAIAAAPAVGGAPQPPPALSDPKLRVPVALAGRAVYLGEALEELSRKTGVRLQVPDRPDPASGLRLTFWVRHATLREVMEALARLLDSPYDRWRWRVSGTGEGRSYFLEHAHSMSAAAAAYRKEREAAFEADCWAIYRAARAGTPGMQRLRQLRPDLGPGFEDRLWAANELLGALDEGQMRSLVKGGSASVPGTALSAAQAEALRRALQSPSAAPASWRVGFQVDRGESSLGLAIIVSGPGIGLASTPWVGHAVGQRPWQGWSRAPGKAQQAEFDRIRAKLKERPVAVRRQTRMLAYPELLQRLSEANDLNIIAETPDGSRSIEDPMPPLDEVLFGLGAGGGLPWIKSGSITVCRRGDAWTIGRDSLVPWPDIRALRATTARRDGFLDAEALGRLARLTPAQWQGLETEFPDAGAPELRAWQPVLLLPALMDPTRARALRSEKGLAARDLSPAALKALFPEGKAPAWPGAGLLKASPEAVVRLGDDADAKGPAVTWTIRPPEAAEQVFRFRLRKRQPLDTPRPAPAPRRRPMPPPEP